MVSWGKMDELGRQHPLTAHMLDVAASFAALVQLHSVRRAFERVAGRELMPVDWARLGALAFLHDVGKANAGFQAKQWLRNGQTVPAGWPPCRSCLLPDLVAKCIRRVHIRRVHFLRA